MSDLLTAPARTATLRETPVPADAAPRETSAAVPGAKVHAAWTWLFAALCASAGQGLVLGCALYALYGLPNLRELGGMRTALVVAWFVACIPLAALAYARRERLQRSRSLVVLSRSTVLITAVAFLLYLAKVALG